MGFGMSSEKTIGLIGGTGNLGKGIALRFASAGFKVIIGSRKNEKAKIIADQVNKTLGSTLAIGMQNSEVLKHSKYIFLTIPFQHVRTTLESLKTHFTDRHVIIDTTVPLSFVNKKPTLQVPKEGSAASYVKSCLPSNVKLVTALKTVSSHALEEVSKPLNRDTFVCGDDAKTKKEVITLLSNIDGLNPIDAGPLEVSRYVEPMTVLAVHLNKKMKQKSVGFKVVIE